MPPTAKFEFEKAWKPPLKEPDLVTPQDEIESHDQTARKNLETTFYIIPKPLIKTPQLSYIYYSQQYTTIANVPSDLQLEWFFNNFNKLAREGFIAKQEGQDKQLTRAIWFYNLNPERSFSRYFRTIRANLLAMTWVLTNNFSAEYCNPGAQTFVIKFVEAWMSGLTETGSLATQDFTARERFINFWMGSEYDLLDLNKTAHEWIQKRINRLKHVELPPDLARKANESPADILKMRRDGVITEAEFREFGGRLLLSCINGMKIEADRVKKKTFKDIEVEEAGRQLEMMHSFDDVDPRRKVDWDSGLVKALLGAVEQGALHPSVVQKQVRPPQLREPWIDKDIFFGLIRRGMKPVEVDVDPVSEAFGQATLDEQE